MKKIIAIVGTVCVAAAAYAAGCYANDIQKVEGSPKDIRPCQCDCSKECKCPDGCNCNVCRKCVEAAWQRSQQKAVVTNSCTCKCECHCCCNCRRCHCDCECGCCKQLNVTEYQEQIVSTNNVSVKEYRVGNRFFGASMTVSHGDKPPMPSRDILIDLPPPPPVCRVWVEGYWGWGQAPSGYYLRRWVPGHYESVTAIQ